MKRGDKGAVVRAFQRDLLRLGYPLPKSTQPSGELDGLCGPETLAMARLLEQDRAWPVSPNGIIDAETLRRAQKAEAYARGLDVSQHQGEIGWSLVAGAGYRFVYAKATEGRTHEDPTWRINRAGAAAAGLEVGAYHYWWPKRDAKIQAEHFFHVATQGGKRALPLAPALDVEMDNDLEPAEINARLQSLIDETTRLWGRVPVIYSSRRVYTEWGLAGMEKPAGAECPFWMVSWSSKERLVAPWDSWALWQTGPERGVPGINSLVDRNLARF
jgi:GH25 family lysozyme M1 (1,4-beta-N-acetylmuramidase)